MADVAGLAPGGEFSIGRVGSRTFAVLGRNFINFLLLALLVVIPQVLVSNVVSRWYLAGGLTPAAVGRDFFSPRYLLPSLGMWLLSVVMSSFLHAALTYGTVMDLSGRRVSLQEALVTALKIFLPVALIGILYFLGFTVGLLLLLVPGLMLAVAWSVVVPVRVIENTGVFDTFSRGAQLTKGQRWPIFGLVLIYLIGVLIFTVLTRPIFGVPMLAQPGGWPIGYVVFTTIQTSVLAAVSATGVACIYYELRSAKEGMGPEQLAAVFD